MHLVSLYYITAIPDPGLLTVELYNHQKVGLFAVITGVDCNFEKLKYESRGLRIGSRLIHIKIVSAL